MVVGARESFQYFKQITWFLGNDIGLSEFGYKIFNYWNAGAIFNNVVGLKAWNFNKKRPSTGIFLRILRDYLQNNST